ncbi:hypothetical protein K1T71_014186 [Dendrolimus kikuchii]|uniref:Uncharacterized protein n=1 Tax=Dendrolimus kikuchii TaxID=765133 RepID=A0ACC1CFA4_9NEOP|nr:hypothetical protein K1T71_014186 [Dendrolimus kikuchii]
MAAKLVLALCASVLLVQSAAGQCLARGLGAPWGGLGYGAYGAGCGCGGLGAYGGYGIGADIAAASSLNAAYGGGLGVASGSAMGPTGLNVASENVYEGPVAVAGNLPFLGTVAVEGAFPTVGAGAVSYGCGDGALGITGEDFGAGIGYGGLGYGGLGYGGLGYGGLGYGYAGRLGGCGCGGALY